MDVNSSGESCDLEEDTTGSDESSTESSNESPESSPTKGRGRIKRRGRPGRWRSTSPIIPLSDPQEGQIVWAKVRKSRWWPAMLVKKEDCGKLAFIGKTRACRNFVYWFGDGRVSPIPMSKLVDFKKGFQRFMTPPGSKNFISGVYLAIKEMRKSLSLDIDDYDITKALAWAENGFPLPEEHCEFQAHGTVPEHVQNKLKTLRVKYEENEDNEEDEEDDDNSEELEEVEPSAEEVDIMNLVRDETLDLSDICLACLAQVNELQEHPFLHGSICNLCMEKLRNCSFSIGLDMIAFHCCVCMNSGQMMVCSQPFCYRAFCSKCIKLKATLGVLDCIRESDPWLCFMCTPFTSEMHGFLRPRSVDWKENMWQTFHSKMSNENVNILNEISLRVLCLDGSCDSVMSILSILKKMGTKIEMLFLCNFNDSEMERLDPFLQHCTYSIKSINENEEYEELSTLTPIHIVIASPEDGERESFGSKFFSFHNILSMIDVLNQTCNQPTVPLMWIFQMPPPYWQDYVILISRYLQFDPAVWSRKASQVKSENLVWTNISAMWAFLEDAAMLQRKYQPETRNKKLNKVESLD